MEECFLSATQDDGSIICMAPLTDRQIAVADIDLDDKAGVYLFVERGPETDPKVQVIARVLSEEAALRLQTAFRLS